jgi:broad specificity phosphatase PhoE
VRLVLVRHAEVALELDRPAPEWRLTDAGRAAAAALAGSRSWDGVELVATSPEPKARDTAEPIAAALGLPLRVEDDLREVERGGLPVLERADYVALVARYLGGEPVEGWEPATEALERFAACIDRLLGETTSEVVAVTHGLVIALFLGLTLDEWTALPLPAVLQPETWIRRTSRPR